jgi:hypothetical protein
VNKLKRVFEKLALKAHVQLQNLPFIYTMYPAMQVKNVF